MDDMHSTPVADAAVADADQDQKLVEQMVQLSGAGVADCVAIAGPEHLGLLLALCRRGFVRAECVAVATGPRLRSEIDVLWIPGTGSEQDVAAALTRMLRMLRPGGTVVVTYGPQAATMTDVTPSRRLRDFRRTLTGFGLAPLGVDGSRTLIAAYKPWMNASGVERRHAA